MNLNEAMGGSLLFQLFLHQEKILHEKISTPYLFIIYRL